jgi:predicted transglutaminase-like protease
VENEKMQWLGCVFFTLITLAYIWNGDDLFNKKQWFLAGVMFVLVLVATVVIGFTLKWLAQSMSLFSVATAKHYSIIFSMSFLCVWGLKVTVVLLCTIFSGIIGRHKKYNAENYGKISSMTHVVAPGLLIIAKIVVSLGSVLMFSGLWLK